MKRKNQNRRKKPIKNRKSKSFGRKVSNKLKAFGRKFSNKGSLQLFNSEIVYDPMPDPKYEALPDSVKAQVGELHKLAQSQFSENAVSPLLALIEEYPHIP